ncbi:unnamed protein product [Camellia sinensis]
MGYKLAELVEVQKPQFLVFACSGSRVCPSCVLNFKPGQAFMACNIANLVRYSGVGAVIELRSQLLSDFVHDWIKIGLPAKAKVEAELPDTKDEEKYTRCERGSEFVTDEPTHPYAQYKFFMETLKLMGGYYDFVNGEFDVRVLDMNFKTL